jgi:hypothetical protein
MILMSELLKDSFYRAFIEKTPEQPELAKDKARMKSPPWVVYIQREADGKWGRREFWRYQKALKFMIAWLDKGAHDAALNNRRVSFYPPSRLVRIKGKFVVGSDGKQRQATKLVVWKPKVELLTDEADHFWCSYCRRPTIFRYYKRHKALGGMELDQSTARCCICGASSRIAIPHSSKRRY